MRSAFAAIAIGLMTAGQAGASSFVVVEDASAKASDAAPAPIVQDAPVESVETPQSSSIVYLGEPSPTPKASAPAAKPIDNTATASVGNASADGGERARIMTAWAQAEADAEWARTSAIQTPSLMFFGRPSPDRTKIAKAEAKMAATNPFRAPTVMRGGIAGDLFPTAARAPNPDLAVPTEATSDAPSMTADQQRERTEQRAKEREAKASPERQPLKLSPQQQKKILPNG